MNVNFQGLLLPVNQQEIRRRFLRIRLQKKYILFRQPLGEIKYWTALKCLFSVPIMIWKEY